LERVPAARVPAAIASVVRPLGCAAYASSGQKWRGDTDGKGVRYAPATRSRTPRAGWTQPSTPTRESSTAVSLSCEGAAQSLATRVLLVATQHRLQWQAEQVLDWSALPVVQIRPTVLLENPLFTTLIARSVAEEGVIRLPFGEGRTSPVAAEDVARSVAAVLQSPEPHMAVAGTPGLCTDDQACGISCRQPARHRE
jgi:hypothetical protein